MIATMPAPSPARPLRAWDYFTLNAYWFALSFLWNSMGPILLPTLVAQLVPESQKGSALGTLSALGLHHRDDRAADCRRVDGRADDALGQA